MFEREGWTLFRTIEEDWTLFRTIEGLEQKWRHRLSQILQGLDAAKNLRNDAATAPWGERPARSSGAPAQRLASAAERALKDRQSCGRQAGSASRR